jgi:hypothetical protein
VRAMLVGRERPSIGKPQPSPPAPKAGDDALGCITMPFVIVAGYVVLSAIVRVTSNAGSRLDRAICWGTLAFCVIISIPCIRELVRDIEVRRAETKQWMSACTVAQVRIISRHESRCWDDGHRFHPYPPWLELEMTATQRALSPGQTTVHVDVSDHIYDKLARRDTVCIYYRPEAPLVFLLEEECGP